MYLVQSQVQEHFHQFSTQESGGAIQRLVDHRFSFKITLVNLQICTLQRQRGTVRDNLFRLCPNLDQHPPFFSKMRTFFKNRPPWYGFYCNSAPYHGGRFLSCIFKEKCFFPQGFSVRSVGASKLFVLDFPIHPGFIYSPYKMAIFKCP